MAETDFAEFPGRSHLVMLERGFQEIADYVSGWLMRRSVLPSAVKDVRYDRGEQPAHRRVRRYTAAVRGAHPASPSGNACD